MNSPTAKKPTWDDFFDTPFPNTTLNEVAARLKYAGKNKSLDDMQDAISEGAIGRRKQRGIIELFGCMPNDADYDYKKYRS